MYQSLVARHQLDGWLLYDFHGSNSIACDICKVQGMATRRWFYWIPAEGEPVKIVHAIEEGALDHLPGQKVVYTTWQQLEEALKVVRGKVAMEYSPKNALPYVSKVDAGTIEQLNAEVVSSAELLLEVQVLDEKQQKSHMDAATIVSETQERAFLWIRDHLAAGSSITELDVQDFILGEFEARGCVTDHPPIVAAGVNSADPHHESSDTSIHPNNLVLIDAWARLDQPCSVYADFTKVSIQPEHQEVHDIVKRAQQAALDLIRTRLPGRLEGWEVDQACRQVIIDAGYGKLFTHRTGHNISHELHGPGTHMDNFETHDTRPILPGTCFSIEPGIYLPGKFGVRLECNVLITTSGDVIISGGARGQ